MDFRNHYQLLVQAITAQDSAMFATLINLNLSISAIPTAIRLSLDPLFGSFVERYYKYISSRDCSDLLDFSKFCFLIQSLFPFAAASLLDLFDFGPFGHSSGCSLH
jgi:hypothetical protein